MKKFFLFSALIFSFLLVQNPLMAQVQNIDDLYLGRVQKKIGLNWIIPEEKSSRSAVVEFTINKIGEVVCANLVRSSGSDDFDKSALLSIYKAAPFERFQDDFGVDTLSFDYFFNSKILFMNPVEDDSLEASYRDARLTNMNCEDLNFDSYVRNFQKKIKSNWTQSVYQRDKAAVTIITVNKDGSISNVNLLRSSGDKNFDNEILAAINTAAPFDALPDEISRGSIQLQLSFFYNALRTDGGNQYKTSCSRVNLGSHLMYTDETYKAQIESILASNLLVLRYFKQRELLLKLVVGKTGELGSIDVEKSSGNAKFDKKILEALSTSSFPPIPKSLNKESITFNYSIKTKKSKASNWADFEEKVIWLGRMKMVPTCIWDSVSQNIDSNANSNVDSQNKCEKSEQSLHEANLVYEKDNSTKDNQGKKHFNKKITTNSHYVSEQPDISSPITKIWILDTLVRWSFMIFCACRI